MTSNDPGLAGVTSAASVLAQARIKPASTIRNSIGGSSVYRGVMWDAPSRSWRAKIKFKGKTWYLGMYQDEMKAAQAYDCASWFIYGAKAVINFPSVSYENLTPPRNPPSWLMDALLDLVCFFNFSAFASDVVLFYWA